MIVIISGTNRPKNLTKLVAKEYQRLLTEAGIETEFIALDELEVHERNEQFIELEKRLIAAQKFIIVMPEYNGSYPGILKLMIDNTDVNKVWPGKKVLLAGVATGRAGNLRGMEHLTGSLLHMKTTVHFNRLPISSVHKLLTEDGQFKDCSTSETIKKQINEFINF